MNERVIFLFIPKAVTKKIAQWSRLKFIHWWLDPDLDVIFDDYNIW